MKTIFIGPTLPKGSIDLGDISVCGPVECGDVYDAVGGGADVIGIVDGSFEHSRAVLHKEILWALSLGVKIYGAASMGALRAAECAEYGMVPVGILASAFAQGEMYDFADVAVTFGPAELDYPLLTEALADVRATLQNMRSLGEISDELAARLNVKAAQIFYKHRTIAALFEGVEDAELLQVLYVRHRVSLKTQDAVKLVKIISAETDARADPPTSWQFESTAAWAHFLQQRAAAA